MEESNISFFEDGIHLPQLNLSRVRATRLHSRGYQRPGFHDLAHQLKAIHFSFVDFYVNQCSQYHIEPSAAVISIMEDSSFPTSLKWVFDGIDLSHHHIYPILDILALNRRLKYLSFVSCNLTNSSVGQLLSILPLLHLRSLHLSHNEITDVVGESLLQMLRSHPTMKNVVAHHTHLNPDLQYCLNHQSQSLEVPPTRPSKMGHTEGHIVVGLTRRHHNYQYNLTLGLPDDQKQFRKLLSKFTQGRSSSCLSSSSTSRVALVSSTIDDNTQDPKFRYGTRATELVHLDVRGQPMKFHSSRTLSTNRYLHPHPPQNRRVHAVQTKLVKNRPIHDSANLENPQTDEILRMQMIAVEDIHNNWRKFWKGVTALHNNARLRSRDDSISTLALYHVNASAKESTMVMARLFQDILQAQQRHQQISQELDIAAKDGDQDRGAYNDHKALLDELGARLSKIDTTMVALSDLCFQVDEHAQRVISQMKAKHQTGNAEQDKANVTVDHMIKHKRNRSRYSFSTPRKRPSKDQVRTPRKFDIDAESDNGRPNSARSTRSIISVRSVAATPKANKVTSMQELRAIEAENPSSPQPIRSRRTSTLLTPRTPGSLPSPLSKVSDPSQQETSHEILLARILPSIQITVTNLKQQVEDSLDLVRLMNKVSAHAQRNHERKHSPKLDIVPIVSNNQVMLVPKPPSTTKKPTAKPRPNIDEHRKKVEQDLARRKEKIRLAEERRQEAAALAEKKKREQEERAKRKAERDKARKIKEDAEKLKLIYERERRILEEEGRGNDMNDKKSESEQRQNLSMIEWLMDLEREKQEKQEQEEKAEREEQKRRLELTEEKRKGQDLANEERQLKGKQQKEEKQENQTASKNNVENDVGTKDLEQIWNSVGDKATANKWDARAAEQFTKDELDEYIQGATGMSTREYEEKMLGQRIDTSHMSVQTRLRYETLRARDRARILQRFIPGLVSEKKSFPATQQVGSPREKKETMASYLARKIEAERIAEQKRKEEDALVAREIESARLAAYSREHKDLLARRKAEAEAALRQKKLREEEARKKSQEEEHKKRLKKEQEEADIFRDIMGIVEIEKEKKAMEEKKKAEEKRLKEEKTAKEEEKRRHEELERQLKAEEKRIEAERRMNEASKAALAELANPALNVPTAVNQVVALYRRLVEQAKNNPTSHCFLHESVCLKMIQLLLNVNRSDLAYVLAEKALDDVKGYKHGDNMALKYYRCLSLAGSQNFTEAFNHTMDLLEFADVTETTKARLLSLAATLKQYLHRQTKYFKVADQKMIAMDSARLYLTAYALSNDLMEAIQAALMFKLGKDKSTHDTIVRSVLKQAQSQLNQAKSRSETVGKDVLTVIGRAHKSLGRTQTAEKFFEQASRSQEDVSSKNPFLEQSSFQSMINIASNLNQLGTKDLKMGDVASLFRKPEIMIFRGQLMDNTVVNRKTIEAAKIARDSGSRAGHARGSSVDFGNDYFPAYPPLNNLVTKRIDRMITTLNPTVGFTTLSCGADIIFSELLLKKGLELHIVIPFAMGDFIKSSIDYGRRSKYWRSWRNRAHCILSKAAEVHYITNERFLNDSKLFDFAHDIMKGLALLRARELGAKEPTAVAFYDPRIPDPSCIHEFITSWQAQNRKGFILGFNNLRKSVGFPSLDKLEEVDSKSATNTSSSSSSSSDFSSSPSSSSSPTMMSIPGVEGSVPLSRLVSNPVAHLQTIRRNDNKSRSKSSNALKSENKNKCVRNPTKFARLLGRTIRYMAFADCNNIDTLTELQTPLFFHLFFKLVRATELMTGISPIHRETWGAGLYFVFDHVMTCAIFCLDLIERFKKTPWDALGLPSGSCVRFGLHCGTVFPGYNPVIGANCYFGSSVVRAARIKPNAAPGVVLVSEQYAAAVALFTSRNPNTFDVKNDKSRRNTITETKRKRLALKTLRLLFEQNPFISEFLGVRDLAKGYDRCVLYRLAPLRDISKHLDHQTVQTIAETEIEKLDNGSDEKNSSKKPEVVDGNARLRKRRSSLQPLDLEEESKDKVYFTPLSTGSVRLQNRFFSFDNDNHHVSSDEADFVDVANVFVDSDRFEPVALDTWENEEDLEDRLQSCSVKELVTYFNLFLQFHEWIDSQAINSTKSESRSEHDQTIDPSPQPTAEKSPGHRRTPSSFLDAMTLDSLKEPLDEDLENDEVKNAEKEAKQIVVPLKFLHCRKSKYVVSLIHRLLSLGFPQKAYFACEKAIEDVDNLVTGRKEQTNIVEGLRRKLIVLQLKFLRVLSLSQARSFFKADERMNELIEEEQLLDKYISAEGLSRFIEAPKEQRRKDYKRLHRRMTTLQNIEEDANENFEESILERDLETAWLKPYVEKFKSLLERVKQVRYRAMRLGSSAYEVQSLITDYRPQRDEAKKQSTMSLFGSKLKFPKEKEPESTQSAPSSKVFEHSQNPKLRPVVENAIEVSKWDKLSETFLFLSKQRQQLKERILTLAGTLERERYGRLALVLSKEDALEVLKKSADKFVAAYTISSRSLPAINAATTLYSCGDVYRARRVAREAVSHVAFELVVMERQQREKQRMKKKRRLRPIRNGDESEFDDESTDGDDDDHAGLDSTNNDNDQDLLHQTRGDYKGSSTNRRPGSRQSKRKNKLQSRRGSELEPSSFESDFMLRGSTVDLWENRAKARKELNEENANADRIRLNKHYTAMTAMAEAYVVLGKFGSAQRWYQRAVQRAVKGNLYRELHKSYQTLSLLHSVAPVPRPILLLFKHSMVRVLIFEGLGFLHALRPAITFRKRGTVHAKNEEYYGPKFQTGTNLKSPIEPDLDLSQGEKTLASVLIADSPTEDRDGEFQPRRKRSSRTRRLSRFAKWTRNREETKQKARQMGATNPIARGLLDQVSDSEFENQTDESEEGSDDEQLRVRKRVSPRAFLQIAREIKIKKSYFRYQHRVTEKLTAKIGEIEFPKSFQILYTMLTERSELLMAERMIERGWEIHIIIPFSSQSYWRICHRSDLSLLSRWKKRILDVLDVAVVHHINSQRYMGLQFGTTYGAKIMLGLASIRSNELMSAPGHMKISDNGISEMEKAKMEEDDAKIPKEVAVELPPSAKPDIEMRQDDFGDDGAVNTLISPAVVQGLFGPQAGHAEEDKGIQMIDDGNGQIDDESHQDEASDKSYSDSESIASNKRFVKPKHLTGLFINTSTESQQRKEQQRPSTASSSVSGLVQFPLEKELTEGQDTSVNEARANVTDTWFLDLDEIRQELLAEIEVANANHPDPSSFFSGDQEFKSNEQAKEQNSSSEVTNKSGTLANKPLIKQPRKIHHELLKQYIFPRTAEQIRADPTYLIADPDAFLFEEGFAYESVETKQEAEQIAAEELSLFKEFKTGSTLASLGSPDSKTKQLVEKITNLERFHQLNTPAVIRRLYPRVVRHMLFADVKNYSKLNDVDTPLFCTTFLALVQEAIDETPPEMSNTWGDGLFMAFESAIDMAVFALGLLDRVCNEDWGALGLPPSLTLRVGIHSGPVFRGYDPIIHKISYFGQNVGHAALIEPVASPGCAFVTEQFAACLAEETFRSGDKSQFRLDYMGNNFVQTEIASQKKKMKNLIGGVDQRQSPSKIRTDEEEFAKYINQKPTSAAESIDTNQIPSGAQIALSSFNPNISKFRLYNLRRAGLFDDNPSAPVSSPVHSPSSASLLSPLSTTSFFESAASASIAGSHMTAYISPITGHSFAPVRQARRSISEASIQTNHSKQSETTAISSENGSQAI